MRIDIKETKDKDIVQVTTIDERFYRRESDKKIVPSSSWIASYYPKGVGFYKWLAEHGWDEAESLKNEASERGSKIHQGIEMLLNRKTISHDHKFINPETLAEEEVTVSEYEALISFARWYEETKPEILSTEMVVFNDEHNYAGTMDFKCKIAGEVWIIDFKTSQNIWASHELQISSYKHCPENKDVQKIGILQIGYQRNKARFKFIEIEDKFELFLAAQLIWKNENENVKPKQHEFPRQLSLNIKEK